MATLYDSGEMSVGGNRDRVTVTKTARGIEVTTQSLYSDAHERIEYYADGNYPALPDDWAATVGDQSSVGVWLRELEYYTPDRRIDPAARRMGASRSAAKAASSRANGRKGGRPRKRFEDAGLSG